jgi:hypothetical protein
MTRAASKNNYTNLSVSSTTKANEYEALSSYMFGGEPPNALKLEESVLGAILQDSSAIDIVKAILVEEDCYYKAAHNSIYNAMLELRKAKKPVDILTVTKQLEGQGKLQEAGGAYYLVELTNRVASAANVEYWAKIILQEKIKRRLILEAYNTIKKCFNKTDDVFETLDELDIQIVGIKKNIGAVQYTSLAKALEKAKKEKNPYPIHAFPKELQQIMLQYSEINRFPISYVGSVVLATVSTAIGNAMKMQLTTEYATSLSLYIALVGEPGTSKTWTIKKMAAPLFKRDKELQEMYQAMLAAWTEEKEDFELSHKGTFTKPQPKEKQLYVDDTTMEALIKAFASNPQGVISWRDELIELFNSLNAYRGGGGDGQKLLKFFDGSFVRVNRSSGESVTVENPFITVVGGIQPDVLKMMASNGRLGDGTMGRFCFDYPTNQNRPDRINEVMHENTIERYDEIIRYIFNLPNYYMQMGEEKNYKSINLRFDNNAQMLYREWEDNNNKIVNASTGNERTVHVKSENLCLRISALLQTLYWSCEKTKFKNIIDLEIARVGVAAVEGAIAITEYFRNCALYVLDKLETPVANLDKELRVIYEQLPEEFSTTDLIEMCKIASVSEATGRRHILNNTTLVRKVRNGTYQKLWV